ncbi:hypothetical protein C8Q79DRAFT_706309 [Trametes meyenii]|nr:hypothetical protein C8Q79DRAFT_706309 [Trametes meyenii]
MHHPLCPPSGPLLVPAPGQSSTALNLTTRSTHPVSRSLAHRAPSRSPRVRPTSMHAWPPHVSNHPARGPPWIHDSSRTPASRVLFSRPTTTPGLFDLATTNQTSAGPPHSCATRARLRAQPSDGLRGTAARIHRAPPEFIHPRPISRVPQPQYILTGSPRACCI